MTTSGSGSSVTSAGYEPEAEADKLIAGNPLRDSTGKRRRGYGGLSSGEDTEDEPRVRGVKKAVGSSTGSGKGFSARRLVPDPSALEATSSTFCNSLLWFFFDIADSWWGMSLGYLGYVPYVLLVGAENNWSYSLSISVALWFISASNLVVAVLSPFLGAMSDVFGNRKIAVVISIFFAFAGMIALPFVQRIWWIGTCFAVSNLSNQLARLFYDSQIPFVVELKRRSLIQALGSALGVLGSLFAVCWSLIVKEVWGAWSSLPLQTHSSSSPKSGSELTLGGMKQFLIGSAIGYAVICLPYCFHQEKHSWRNEPLGHCIRRSLRELKETLFDIFHDRNSICFTIGFFLVLDNFFNSQFLGAGILQGAAGFSAVTTDILVISCIPVTFVTAIFGGVLTQFFGCKIGLVICVITFMLSEVGVVFANWHVGNTVIPWQVGLSSIATNGIAVGFLVVTGRFFIVQLSQPARVAQWGGFQRVLSQTGSVISPLVYSGILSIAVKNHVSLNMAYRFVFFFRLILFSIALVLILLIVDPHKRYLAGERAPYYGLYAKARCCPQIVEPDPTVIEDVSDEDTATPKSPVVPPDAR